jgi:hypothetical protein
MASVIQFVDSIASSPTVRLDLNSASLNLMVSDSGIDISPPNLTYAVASTMLQDGEHIAASSYQNRILKLPIKLVYATSTDAAATTIQNLGRELNRPSNILKLQLDGATSPVFFRTFRSSYAMSMLRLLLTQDTGFTLELPTEYAGYGLLETPVSGVTVSTDPAAGSNGCFVDVTGVKGDVESPAIIRWPGSTTAANRTSIFAARRRGTPSAAPFVFQAEAMTQGTNTTTQANDANFSGAGNNYSRCTFTTATMQVRLSLSDLGTASVDLRGRYRVLLRYRKNTSTDGINLQLEWGGSTQVITNTAFAAPNTTNITTADLGEMSIPAGHDPVVDSSGVELVVSDTAYFALKAERTSGSGTIDFDFLMLVPADDRTAVVKWTDPTGSTWLLDGRDNNPYHLDASDRVISVAAPSVSGGVPMLSPNQTNRIVMLRETRSEGIWSLTTVSPVSVSYMPRYLTVRPAST